MSGLHGYSTRPIREEPWLRHAREFYIPLVGLRWLPDVQITLDGEILYQYGERPALCNSIYDLGEIADEIARLHRDYGPISRYDKGHQDIRMLAICTYHFTELGNFHTLMAPTYHQRNIRLLRHGKSVVREQRPDLIGIPVTLSGGAMRMMNRFLASRASPVVIVNMPEN